MTLRSYEKRWEEVTKNKLLVGIKRDTDRAVQ